MSLESTLPKLELLFVILAWSPPEALFAPIFVLSLSLSNKPLFLSVTKICDFCRVLGQERGVPGCLLRVFF